MNNIHKDLIEMRELVSKRENNVTKEFLVDSINSSYCLRKSIIETEHAYKIYYDRWRVQEEVTKAKVVTGYEDLLEYLDKEEDIEVSLTSIVLENAVYIIFSSLDHKSLIGILKSTNSNLSKEKEIDKINESRHGNKYKSISGPYYPPLNDDKLTS